MRSEVRIETMHPRRNRGIKISTLLYEHVVHFILGQITISDGITLALLLKLGEEHFGEEANINHLIYHVKLDLEVRGLIKMVAAANESPLVLKLTTQGKRAVKEGKSFLSDKNFPVFKKI